MYSFFVALMEFHEIVQKMADRITKVQIKKSTTEKWEVKVDANDNHLLNQCVFC